MSILSRISNVFAPKNEEESSMPAEPMTPAEPAAPAEPETAPKPDVITPDGGAPAESPVEEKKEEGGEATLNL